ncbi:hypothetical protein K440DRAFT_597477 [Wilcoxina mikolae CBS 423.85]|nr:hypothetical protein K440DRAFT_597477 [Wilcoxina mikolae CBS 423.85]
MVTTRRGNIKETESEPAHNKAAGKKHKDTKKTADEKEEPEKKKAKSTTTTTPKKSGAQKKKKEGKGKGNGTEEKKATVEEVTDSDADPKKHNPRADDDAEMPDATTANSNSGDSGIAVEEAREQKVEDSPILEKGLVYFFLRGKVNVEHPESMDDVKRSYMVLRPLPQGTKLVDGKIQDGGKNRLIAIPKKRLPSKGYEKFLTFVEVPEANLEDLREKYLKGRTYQTKTMGERTDFPAQPIGEGVYAITKSDNERQSHFAYILTIPKEPNELQEDFGLKDKGSFIISVRNPQTPAPPNAGIPDPAKYPKEIMEEFRGLKWGAVQPKHLDYQNAEILFIGEKSFPHEGDHKRTAEELDLLEEEDDKRVAHLKGSESVFSDLELIKKDFLGIQTTWG